MNLLEKINNEMTDKPITAFRVGDTVKVHYKVVEGGKERIQPYEGIIISRKGAGISRNITIRKISYGVGVERVLPVYAPRIDKIEIVKRGKVRRAKLFYLRERRGKAARVKERETR